MKDFLLKPVPAKWCLGAFVLLFWVGQSWATCSFLGSDNNSTFTVTVPATLAVPKNTPNGTELFRSSPVTLSNVPGVTCSGDGWGYYNSRGATAESDPSPIGTTGLGWRYIYQGYELRGHPSAGTFSGGAGINGTTAALQIVKIGTVTSGSISGGVIGTFRVGSNNLDVSRMSLSNAINITEVSCQTPSVNVALGKHRSSEFGAVGSSIGQTAFNIQLNNCPGGLGGISYRLDPVNTAFNAGQGILALDAGGATGVGIQITNASNGAIGLGEVHGFRTAPPAGNYSIPLRAAYYKTANTVTGGPANASLQFTITYQ
ncbi:fimbrial protein [Pseudomonas caspiana]|uniref:fimbrial protein n=1 Tax=Pseudomonas caspiana TaxID=1451454 RepID=UPI0032F051C4